MLYSYLCSMIITFKLEIILYIASKYKFIYNFCYSLQCPDDFTGEAMLKAVKKNECNKL